MYNILRPEIIPVENHYPLKVGILVNGVKSFYIIHVKGFVAGFYFEAVWRAGRWLPPGRRQQELRSGRIHRVWGNMDSQGRKVVVCDNGTGVSVTAELIRLASVWLMLYFAAVWDLMTACRRQMQRNRKWSDSTLFYTDYLWFTHDPWCGKTLVGCTDITDRDWL